MALAASVAVAVAAIGLRPDVTHACSAGGDWEPARESDVIVGGQILGYEPLSPPVATNPMVPIRLRMRIDHVYKGELRSGEIVVDERSLIRYTDETASQVGRTHDWAGGSGGCGTIDHEPTGWYAVYGLHRGETDGWLTTNRLTTFYLAPEPYEVNALAYLNDRLGLPAVGVGSRDTAPFKTVIVKALAVCTGVAAACLVIGWRVRTSTR